MGGYLLTAGHWRMAPASHGRAPYPITQTARVPHQQAQAAVASQSVVIEVYIQTQYIYQYIYRLNSGWVAMVASHARAPYQLTQTARVPHQRAQAAGAPRPGTPAQRPKLSPPKLSPPNLVLMLSVIITPPWVVTARTAEASL